jgi:two-component system, response regulator
MNHKFSILIADDDTDDQYIVQQAISELYPSNECTAVYDGMQLMDILENSKSGDSFIPDVIILDINMPLLDGFSALEKIRANERLKDLPVFILTTSRHEDDIIKSKELGANYFYSKPSEFDTLKNIVKDIFSRSVFSQNEN